MVGGIIPLRRATSSRYDGRLGQESAIWVYGVGEDRILAFTDFGIESLIELIKMHKNDPTLLKRWNRSE